PQPRSDSTPTKPSASPPVPTNGSSSAGSRAVMASAADPGPPASSTPIAATSTSATSMSVPCSTSDQLTARKPPKNVYASITIEPQNIASTYAKPNRVSNSRPAATNPELV